MALTEEQQEHWDEALKDAKHGVDWYAVSSDVLLAVADHLAEVEAALASERAKVARLREAIGEMTLTTDLKKIGQIGFAVLDETEAPS